MKIYIERFVANNPDLTFDDVVRNIRAGVTQKGTVNVHFETRDKYIDVDANGSVYEPDYTGNTVRLFPYIYDGERYLDRGDDDEQFYNHSDFWSARLVVEMDHTNYSEIVVPLKHEYFVSYVPDNEVMNYVCLGDVEIIGG